MAGNESFTKKMRRIKEKIRKINELLDEIRSYEIYKEHLMRKLDLLFSEYQKKKYTFEGYEQRKFALLEGKTKKEWIAYYKSCIYSLLKQVEELNAEIFYEAYENKDFQHLKPVKVAAPEEEIKKNKDVFDDLARIEKKYRKAAKKEEKEKLLLEYRKQKLLETDGKSKGLQRINEKLKVPLPPKLFPGQRKDELQKPVSLKIPRPKDFRGIRTGKEALDLAGQLKKQQSKQIGIGGTFGLDFLKTLVKRFAKTSRKEDGRKTLLDLKLQSKSDAPLFEKGQEQVISHSLIAEEARRIKNILGRKKTPSIYQPSFFGAVANIMIKRISFFLLDNFPEFFKTLYNALRLANIKVLSNTYVNIMVLFTIITFTISMPLTFLHYASRTTSFMTVLSKTAFTSTILGLTMFIGFYAYPFLKLKDRKRNINSNMPFAINHMAAVSGSGVPPTRMFQLIADSPEYGEVSTEVAKIVEYIELFGYDFLTALRSVSAISPSTQYKEFLEGLISTIESGGDMKEYLAQKADEAMLNYELERQKYTESISTYSDVYTGIMIAAPLFFVTALSMVSVLGGSVGGLDVNFLTIIGTYLVVPLLNIGFIIFLNMTQPDI